MLLLTCFWFCRISDEITPTVGGNGVRSVWGKYYAEIWISSCPFLICKSYEMLAKKRHAFFEWY